MAQIILTKQGQVLSKHPFPHAGELTIGRQPGNDIVIDHISVSSKHAKISRAGNDMIMTDLGSTNGTFVNNERTGKSRLTHQDWITIGGHVLIVDFYGTLSLHSAVNMLMNRSSSARNDADLTYMCDMSPGPSPDIAFDHLTFIRGGQGDYELFKNKVSIGRNHDADIAINGFWSFLAGRPSARIIRTRGGTYAIGYVNGIFIPKVNGKRARHKTRLVDGDIIQIGPVKLKVNLKQKRSGFKTIMQ